MIYDLLKKKTELHKNLVMEAAHSRMNSTGQHAADGAQKNKLSHHFHYILPSVYHTCTLTTSHTSELCRPCQ